MTATIVGNIDFAQVTLYLFWVFFFGLVIWIQRENMREGYPLQSEVTGEPCGAQPYGLPSPTTYKLPHGGGEVVKPDPNDWEPGQREFAMRKVSYFSGSAYEPTGDPLADGIGPAAYCLRMDKPDLNVEGEAKVVPMRVAQSFSVPPGGGRDPRGFDAVGADGEIGGVVKDIWIDTSEQTVRYFEIELPGDAGVRLVPYTLCIISRWTDSIRIHSLKSTQFAGVPTTKQPARITLLEEDKISAYWCGGKLYADRDRVESQI
ncbi:MAG: photosynthetic reaction center subunit H [Pseudomonadota bacterium]